MQLPGPIGRPGCWNQHRPATSSDIRESARHLLDMLNIQEHRQLKSGDRVLIERAVRLEVLQKRKWSVDLIVAMARGIHRHSRLHACLPGLSAKVMTDCLRSLNDAAL